MGDDEPGGVGQVFVGVVVELGAGDDLAAARRLELVMAKDGDLEGHYRELGKRVPVGRVAEAAEFADLVAFLASERAAFITGTAINFDGGISPVV